MSELVWKSSWGETRVYPHIDREEPLSISLLCKDEEYGFIEPFASVTVNVGEPCGKTEAFVKNYSENEGMEEFLIENNLAYPTGRAIQSGFVTIRQFRFDMEEIKKHSFVKMPA